MEGTALLAVKESIRIGLPVELFNILRYRVLPVPIYADTLPVKLFLKCGLWWYPINAVSILP
jgi:hypothetical protein